MLFAYLLIGFVFGTGTAAFALLNGSGIFLALMAYAASGAVAILVPLMLQVVFGDDSQETWGEGASATGHIGA